MIKTTNVFSRNIEAYNRGDRLIINQGGTSSGKTWAILTLLYLIAKKSTTPKTISIVSQSLPHLKLGALRDFKNILTQGGEIVDKLWNKTDNIFTIGESIIEFFSTDNLGKVHGPRRDILFINECNNVDYKVFDQLAIRTRKAIFLDYNPVSEFWVHETVIPNEDHEFIKSTYLDNEFLEPEIVKQIESKKFTNENWWRVYGLGEIGQYEGAIFTRWTTGLFDTSLPYGFGLDFGFNDPDALSKVAIDKKRSKIYIDECVYSNGLSTAQLSERIAVYCTPRDLIIADAAEARLIYELAQKFNIKPANKKAGSVQEGIKMMQDYELIITPDSHNLAKELNNYVWSDRKAAIPEKGWDHIIDSVRYYVTHQSMGYNKRVLIATDY